MIAVKLRRRPVFSPDFQSQFCFKPRAPIKTPFISDSFQSRTVPFKRQVTTMQPIKYQIAPFSQVFQFLSNIQQYNAHHPRCLSPSASEAIQLCCRHIFGNIPRSKSSEVPKPMRDFISCVEELRRRRAVYIDFCNDSMNVIYQFQDGYMNTRTIIGRLWAANVHKGFTVNNESAFSTSFGNRSSGVLNPGATDFVPKFPIAKTDAVVKSADNDKIVNSEAESTSGSWGTPTSSVTKTSPASTLVGWIPYESDDSFGKQSSNSTVIFC